LRVNRHRPRRDRDADTDRDLCRGRHGGGDKRGKDENCNCSSYEKSSLQLHTSIRSVKAQKSFALRVKRGTAKAFESPALPRINKNGNLIQAPRFMQRRKRNSIES
jgi:hypothetical protein